MEPRTESCIALFLTGNANGDVYMISLRTNAVVRRSQFTILPTPADVIDRLNMVILSDKRRPERDPVFHIWGRDLLDDTPIPLRTYRLGQMAPNRHMTYNNICLPS